MPAPNVFVWSIDEAGPQYIYRKPRAPRCPEPIRELEGARPKSKRPVYVPKQPKPTLANKVAHAKRAVLNSAAVKASTDAYYDRLVKKSRLTEEEAADHEAKKARIAVLDDVRRLPLDWVPIPGFAEECARSEFGMRLMPIERAREYEHVAYRAFPVELARGKDPMGPSGACAVDVGRAKKLLQML
ncbi:hypothetical protein BV20DRAFT_974580 [Pilatotrama ljubarskyi]|nr:hypothetical protein BV20DRAFT_974580 [Pilatotrama ljubarskyi]